MFFLSISNFKKINKRYLKSNLKLFLISYINYIKFILNIIDKLLKIILFLKKI